jgi:cysteine desulfurase
MTKAFVYLDYNATAPLRPEALAAMSAQLGKPGNASSVHGAGRAARGVIESAREVIAAVIGCPPRQIVFTSGGTESNALALAVGRPLLVGATEHDSVLAQAPGATLLPVLADGTLDLGALDAALAAANGPVLVSVMAANNETGVIQPLPAIAAKVRAHGSWLHCDASQALGKIDPPLPCWGAHLLTLSAHKLGGPPGIGALVVSEEVALPPLLKGGGQELGRRAGTENAPAIAGFAAAVTAPRAATAPLRDALEAGVNAIVPGAALGRAWAPRLPGTATLAMPGVPADVQVMALDLEGFAVSAGSACSSGKVRPSHVLTAMGVAPEIVKTCIRVSLGWATTAAEVDAFVAAWGRLYARRGTRTAA